MKTDHLSDEQLERYRDLRLSGKELLEVDDHLSACAPCRERVWLQVGASRSLQGLRAGLSVDDAAHLEHSDLVRLAENSSVAGSDPAALHIAECSPCRDELEDLRRFMAVLASTPRAPEATARASVSRGWFWKAAPIWGAVAAILIMVAVLASARRVSAPQSVSTPAPLPSQAEVELPAEYRQIINQTLAETSDEIPAASARLMRSRGTLRSTVPASGSYQIKGPAGVVVSSDRPQFEWQAVSGAKTYIVAVYDQNYRKVTAGTDITTTTWTPDSALPRGVLLSWQVTAVTPKAVFRFPAPPDPEAVFQVISNDKAAELESIKSRFPEAHLLIGIIYFNAGALDDAAAEFAAIAAGSPDKPQAEQLLGRIHSIRNR